MARSRAARLRRQRWMVGSSAVTAVALAAALAWFAWPFWQLAERFGDRAARAPSRLYGSPTRLAVGEAVDAKRLLAELDHLGYRRSPDPSLSPGEYEGEGGSLAVLVRRHPTPEGLDPGGLLEVEVGARTVRRLVWRGREVRSAALEPPLLASWYGPRLEERRPVEPDELPEDLIHAVLAAEDASFFRHPGLSPRGIARALWVNLRHGAVRQGGSTLTQQLVKNLYLGPERTLLRKAREALLAVLLELRYSKRAILKAYLNEIYLGRSGPVNLIGVGAAAHAYFDKEATHVTLPEAALLAAMIRSPGDYSPSAHPDRARARRDRVLERMAEEGWLEGERLERARAAPVEVRGRPVVVRRTPHFADYAAREAGARFGIAELQDTGHTLLATLRLADQEAAEEAVEWGLDALEQGWEKGRRAEGLLEVAVVALDPEAGTIAAYLGGRDYARSQFDRASQARRQAGSAFKPVVYAAAFEAGIATPASLIEDAPLAVRVADRTWTPRNYDGDFRGWVTARTAVEQSLNTATARVALQVGLQPVLETARAMGVTSPLAAVPSLALGAFEVTPVELATVYATLAAGGLRPEVHGLEAVLDPEGQPLPGRPLAEPERALSPQTAHLVTSVLQGVLDRGTAGSARRLGLYDPLAGKTGTTNEQRDSWFAGYSPGWLALVWVGYDDNSPTRLSGSRAALPIWSRFAQAVRPPGGFSAFAPPPGIATAVIDPLTGELATDACPELLTEVFLEGQVPSAVCHMHGGFFALPVQQPEGVEVDERAHPFRRWLRKVFGNEQGRDRGARPEADDDDAWRERRRRREDG